MRIDFRTIVGAVGIAIPMVFALLLGRFLAPWLPTFSAWINTLGMWAPVVFVSAYVAVVVLMFPAFLLIIVGGAVFGVVKGSLLVMAGALTGGATAFLIARYLARSVVERRVAANPTLAAIDRVIGEDGLRLVFLLRLSPVIPFVLSNYALGVTRVRLRDFVVGTLGLAPIVVTYAAFGSASAAGPHPDGSSAVSPLVLTLGSIITVVLGIVLTRIVQRALREAELTRPGRTADPAPDVV